MQINPPHEAFLVHTMAAHKDTHRDLTRAAVVSNSSYRYHRYTH